MGEDAMRAAGGSRSTSRMGADEAVLQAGHCACSVRNTSTLLHWPNTMLRCGVWRPLVGLLLLVWCILNI